MKTFIPRHIKGGMFSMNFQVGPVTISMLQLVLITFGVGISMAIWKSMSAGGVDKTVAAILASPVALLFLFIAFFNYSELPLLPFIAKLIRTYLIDEPKKYQINYSKINSTELKIKMMKGGEQKQIVEVKKNVIDRTKLKQLKNIV